MTTHQPEQDEALSHETSFGEGLQAVIPEGLSASQTIVVPSLPEERESPEELEREEDLVFEDELPDLGTSFVRPFLSQAMPTVSAPEPPFDRVQARSALSSQKTSRKRRLSLPMIAIFVCVVVILGLLIMNALAQTTPPLANSHGNGSSHPTPQAGKSGQMPVPTTVPTNGTNEQGQGQTATDWVPQQLPPGWTNAGLLTGDGIQALRTAVAFNDREMSLDYRSVGTRNNHGGTFTTATFVMTPAAKQRFLANDVRVINNTLFDEVVNTQLVRLVVNPQPQLVNFATSGQQQFAWVDVAFQLWQSQIDPNHPQQRIEGKELDPTTNQPLVHHMTVLLLRVLPQDAGTNPAMGGTGWLVSNYGLDLPSDAALGLVQPA